MDPLPFFAIFTLIRLIIPFGLILLIGILTDRYFVQNISRTV